MKKENNLPKFWCVLSDQSNPSWKKVIDYLNNLYKKYYYGTDLHCYYDYDGNTWNNGVICSSSINTFINNPTVLTIEQFVEMTEGFVLPEKWYCKPTNEEDAFILGKYFDDNKCGRSIEPNFYQNSIRSILSMGLSNDNFGFGGSSLYPQIPFEQFKKYVMKSKNQIKEFAVGTYIVFLQDYGCSKKGDVDEIISEHSDDDYRYPRCKKEGAINREPAYVKWFATKEEAIEFSETLTSKKQETMRKINYPQAQQIVDIACKDWKSKLFDKWGKQIVLKQEIEIPEEEYQEMRKACTAPQNELFDTIFGKDVKFKVGEYVTITQICSHTGKTFQIEPEMLENVTTGYYILHKTFGCYAFPKQIRLATEKEIQKAKYIPEGTPCLVRDYSNDPWKLAYSNGDNSFKSGSNSYTWNYVKILDINNLPKY